jgi:ribosomal protein S18 acetylase RimI-like enzyme
MQLEVRRLAERDRMRWQALFRAYIAFYGASVPGDVIDLVWRRLLSGKAGEHIGLVAVGVDDVPVGIAHLLLHRSTWSATWYCYLEDLYVDEQFRGRGVGRALIEATYGEADAQGASRTYWVTQEQNTTARALYDAMAARAPFVQYRR